MPFFDSHSDFTAFRGVRELNLDGFVDLPIRFNMGNMQTRAISGQIEFLSFLPLYEAMSDDAPECAKRNLRAYFDCIGVVERFDESLLVVKRSLAGA